MFGIRNRNYTKSGRRSRRSDPVIVKQTGQRPRRRRSSSESSTSTPTSCEQ